MLGGRSDAAQGLSLLAAGFRIRSAFSGPNLSSMWVVRVDYENLNDQLLSDDARLHALGLRLLEHEGRATAGRDVWTVEASVEAATPGAAIEHTENLIGPLIESCNLPRSRIRRVQMERLQT
jgi:hypothetical protein